MKKSSWKLILIIVAGILAVVMLGVFGVQSSQNKAFCGLILETHLSMVIWKLLTLLLIRRLVESICM